ncbi:MAG: ABC-2 transporter permease [Ruminiclostridium sp.]
MVQLDKALIKQYYKYYLIVFLIPVLTVFQYKSIIPSIVFAMCMIAMTTSYTFTVAEKNDLNRLYGLLPVSKKDIVAGRYLFTAIMGFVAIAIILVLDLIVLTAAKVPITMEEVILGIASGIIIYFLSIAIQLPGFFKFGAIKGRFFSFISLFGLFIVSLFADQIGPRLDLKTSSIAILNSPLGMLIFAILFAVVIYSISIGISQRIYNKMEL